MVTKTGLLNWIATSMALITMLFASIYIMARIQEKVSFYVWGYTSEGTVNLRSLNVRSLKKVLNNRGIDYQHALEKSEFRALVQGSGVLREGELIRAEVDDAEIGVPTKDFVTPELFSKEVLAPSHAWLVQVGVNGKWPTLKEDDWASLVQKLGRLGVRTARFDCRGQHYQTKMLCDRKGWRTAQLVLVFPKDNAALNNVVVASYRGKPTVGTIFSWITSALKIVIRDINIEHASHNLQQFEQYWLQEESKTSETIRIVYITGDHSDIPVILPFLRVKFHGRLKIGVARGESGESILEKFGNVDSRPMCLIVTPEGVWNYGKGPGEYMTFEALDMYVSSLVLEISSQDVLKTALALSIMLASIEFCIEQGDIDGFSLLRPFFVLGAMLAPFWIRPSLRQVFLYIRPNILRRLALSSMASLVREDILLGRYTYKIAVLGTLLIFYGLLGFCQKERRNTAGEFIQRVYSLNTATSNGASNQGALGGRTSRAEHLHAVDDTTMSQERDGRVMQQTNVRDRHTSTTRSETRSSLLASSARTHELAEWSPPTSDSDHDSIDQTAMLSPLNNLHLLQNDETLLGHIIRLRLCVVPADPYVRLPKWFFGGEPLESVHVLEIGTNCTICLQDYETGQELCALPCGHEFHAECIDTWLYCEASWHTCPICRQAPYPTIVQITV